MSNPVLPPLAVLPVLPAVYLMKTHIHPLCRPAHVTRHDGRVLVQMHEDSLMAEILMWVAENLTDAERIALRLGFGVDTDLRVPFADGLLDGSVADADLPPALELVAEPEALVSIPRPLRSG